MRRIKTEREYSGGESVVALGMFDGVHKAHQALIRRAISVAREEHMQSIVCTFDKRPADVLHPECNTQMLLSLEERLERFAALGADWALILPFTANTAQIPAEEFLHTLTESLCAKVIVAGFNYTFGKQARGNAQMLERYAPILGYRTEIVPPILDSGERVSSTLIRRLLQNGETERAHALLRLDV